MKYGKEIEALRTKYPRFRNFYLNYKELKRTIKSLTSTAGAGVESQQSPRHRPRVVAGSPGGQAIVADFLKTQLAKINNFVELQHEVIEGEARTRLRVDKEPCVDELDVLARSILDLDGFVRANFTGFRKITKKCDKKLGTTFSAWFMPQVETALFMKLDFAALLTQLGQLYSRWRRCSGQALAQETVESRVDTFLVPPEALMATKLHLLKYLDTGVAGDAETRKRRPSNRMVAPARLGQAEVVTHVYFDNANGDQYAARQRRGSGGSGQFGPVPIFRCRWSGENKGAADVEVHIDALSSEGSAQATLKQRDMAAFFAGTLDANAVVVSNGAAEEDRETAERSVRLVQRVQEAIRDGGHTPLLSAMFETSTYSQRDAMSERAVSAHLEQDYMFIDEQGSGDARSAWCTAASGCAPGTTSSQKLLDAVLRVHVPTGAMDLQWLHQLPSVANVHRAPAFSRAMHGIALLHPEIAVPAPSWMAPQARAAEEPSSLEPGLGTSNGHTAARSTSAADGGPAQRPEAASASAAPGAPKSRQDPLSVPSSGSKVAGKKVTSHSTGLVRHLRALCSAPMYDQRELRVDLKTPLANERTLLRWLRSAVLLASLSALLSSSTADPASQLNGLLLSSLALLFCFWPVLIFRRRSFEYAEGQAKTGQPKADRALPQAMALSLIVILCAVLAVHALFGASQKQIV